MQRIGIIGLGNIAMGKHIPQLQKIADCKITAICDTNERKLKSIGDRLNIPEEYRFTDYNDLINCPEVDAVEVCTPNYLHVPMAVAAVKAGKPVNVEKPLSVDLASTKPLADALAETEVPNMMCFSYRFCPAVRYAKWIMDNGLLGDIVNIDVAYLKNSAFFEGRRLEWRFIKEKAGTGVLGDLGVHLIDLAELLAGDIKAVSGTTDIVVKQRQKEESDEWAPVETDDYAAFLADMASGAKANFMITRCAIGQQNTIKFDVYGTKGVLSFDLNHPDVLGVCIGEVDRMSESIHTVKVPKKFFIEQEQMFINMLNSKECELLPTIKDGLHSQRVLDAIVESAEKRCWVEI